MADRRGRRLARALPQRAARQGDGRRDDRALPEWRAADAGQRLPDAPPAAGLGRQHEREVPAAAQARRAAGDERKSTRLNSSHQIISYAVFCLKKKKKYKKRVITSR